MKPIVLCLPQAGLCNRMRAIASAVKFATTIGGDLIVIWLVNEELNIRFDSLFTYFPHRVINIESRLFKRIVPSILVRLPFQKIIITPQDAENAAAMSEKKRFLIYTARKLYSQVDFSIFKESGLISDQLISSINQNTVGVHIRRTDNSDSIKFSPTSLFVERMNSILQENPDTHFYLATDDEREEVKLKQIFGSRILTHEKRSFSRNSNIGMEDAMIDLSNLSRCGRILGSYWSSFSETAAEWGNCRFEQIVQKK